MNKSENTQQEVKQVESDKAAKLYASIFKSVDSELQYKNTITDFKAGYKTAAASIIQTIENRVKELERHQSEFKPTSNTYQELGYIIIELRNLLTLIKQDYGK